MKSKDKEIILPPMIALFVALAILFLINRVLIKVYFPIDPDPVLNFSISFELTLYLAAYIPILIIAVVFQFLIANRIWNVYRKGNKFLRMNLWQLVIISCLIFGISIAVCAWNKYSGMENFTLKLITATIVAVIYWIVNIYTLKLIEKKSGIKA